MTSGRETARTANTLICLLKGLVGLKITVELRNESCLHGTMTGIDSCMNMTVRDGEFSTPAGQKMKFDDFYVQGKNIRYVQIPDDVDMIATIEGELGIVKKIREHKERKTKLSKEEKKLQRKKRIDEQVEEMKKNIIGVDGVTA